MLQRTLPFAIAMLSGWPGIAAAASATCNAVVHLATVLYPPSVAVSYTSSNDGSQRYCRFSINGYLADQEAPAEFKKLTQAVPGQIAAMAASKVPDSKFITEYLPRLLFAADEKINMTTVANTQAIFQKNLEGFLGCYRQFWDGKNEIKYQAIGSDLRVECSNLDSKTQLETAVFDSRPSIKRAVFISR
jgi:hypothetical protein